MTSEALKEGTPELAALLARLRHLLPPPRLAGLLALVVERPRVERLVARAARGRHPPFKTLGSEALCELAVSAAFAADGGAVDLLHELDRATSGERSLVASVSPAEVRARLGDGRALRIPRHGAKLVWALARDGRPEMGGEAAWAAELYFNRPPEVASTSAAAPAMSPQQLAVLEAEISQVEKERARLIAEVGKREAELRYETGLRKELAARIAELEQRALVAAPSPGGDPSVRNELRRLEKRVAHQERELEELAGSRQRVAALEEDNERLRATVASLRAARALEQGPREEPRSAEAKVPGLQPTPQVSAAIAAAIGTPLVAPPRRVKARLTASGVRVGVFVDVANVSGAARRVAPGRAVDYVKLLTHVLGGRTLVEARAYVIDKEGDSFDAFHAALRHAGYKVASKKPKTFADGTVKADWDVGITVDVLAAVDKLDVVVLASGDGDFVPLVGALKRAQLQVEGVAFGERAAAELKAAVDHFLELDAGVLEE